jgi:hypothetical protein
MNSQVVTRPASPDFSFLSVEERKLIETKLLKCSRCHQCINGNRIGALVEHYADKHGNVRPKGYGVENIGEFISCYTCHKWVPDLNVPQHALTCDVYPKRTPLNKNNAQKSGRGVTTFNRLFPTEEEFKILKEAIKSVGIKNASNYKNPLVGPESIGRLAPWKMVQ